MSFILLGILNSQAAGAGGAGAYDLLESTVLTSSASSVSFTGLDSYSDYKHLQIRMVARNDESATVRDAVLRFNNDSGSNYTRHNIFGNGSSVDVRAETNQNVIDLGSTTAASSASNSFGVSVVDILDFNSTTKNTTVRTLNGQIDLDLIILVSGAYISTDAVNSLEIFAAQSRIPDGSNFIAGSRFSIYGIR